MNGADSRRRRLTSYVESEVVSGGVAARRYGRTVLDDSGEWMLLDEFVSEIREIVQSFGFENFLAFAYYPGQRWGRVLGELPPESEPEAAVLKWAEIWAMEGEEFLVAFKVDPRHFKAVRRSKGGEESGIFEAPEFVRCPDTVEREPYWCEW